MKCMVCNKSLETEEEFYTVRGGYGNKTLGYLCINCHCPIHLKL